MRTVLVWTMLLGLGGCVAPPEKVDPKLGFTLPGQWEGESISEPTFEKEWWTEFGDATLNRVVEKSLANNQDVQIAFQRLEASGAQSRIEGSELYPTVDMSFSGTKQRQNFVGLPIPGAGGVLVSRNQSFNWSMGASWELDLWGRVRSGKKAAIAEMQASALDYEAVRLSLAGNVVVGWISAVAAQQQWELAKATTESYRDTAEKVRDRYERGIRSSLDLRLALNGLSVAEAQEETWSISLKRAIRQLKILQGLYPGSEAELPRELPELSEELGAGLPVDLVSRRPDLLAAERRVAAAGQRTKQSKANLLPRISLTSSGGRVSENLEDLLDNNFSVWSLAANVAQPIFQGGRLIAGVDLSKSREREAALSYVNTALRAFAEVENALSDELALTKIEDDRKQAALQSQAAYALSDERYASGLEGFITLLESQRRAFGDASLLILARQNRLVNRVDLILALGGGLAVGENEREVSLVPQSETLPLSLVKTHE